MVHHRAGFGIHPAAGGHADAERGRRRAGAGREQFGEAVRGPVHHPRGFQRGVRDLGPHQHPAAQVEQRHGDARHGDVHGGHHVPGQVQVHRHVRASGAVRAHRRRQFAQQAEFGQPGAVAGHRGRGEPGDAGDRAAGDRAVVEQRAQHGARVGPAARAVGHLGGLQARRAGAGGDPGGGRPDRGAGGDGGGRGRRGERHVYP